MSEINFGISYFGNRDIKHVEKDLLELKKIGFKKIVHTYSENDFKFYEKTMKDIVELSENLGFETWIDPWGVGGIFGGEAFSGFLQDNMPEAQISNLERSLGSVCFYSEKFRNFIKKWIDSVKFIGGKIIFWDEPHFHLFNSQNNFPNEWSCRCNRCTEKFKKEFHYEMPLILNEDIVKFRNDSILDFFKFITSYAEEIGLKNYLCFLPEESKEIGITNYEDISSLNNIENVGSDPYWYAFNKPIESFVEETTKKISEISKKYSKDNHIWIQSFKVPNEREEEIYTAFEIIKNYPIKDVLFWGTEGCKIISSISSDNPEKVWEIIKNIVKNNDSM